MSFTPNTAQNEVDIPLKKFDEYLVVLKFENVNTAIQYADFIIHKTRFKMLTDIRNGKTTTFVVNLLGNNVKLDSYNYKIAFFTKSENNLEHSHDMTRANLPTEKYLYGENGKFILRLLNNDAIQQANFNVQVCIQGRGES